MFGGVWGSSSTNTTCERAGPNLIPCLCNPLIRGGAIIPLAVPRWGRIPPPKGLLIITTPYTAKIHIYPSCLGDQHQMRVSDTQPWGCVQSTSASQGFDFDQAAFVLAQAYGRSVRFFSFCFSGVLAVPTHLYLASEVRCHVTQALHTLMPLFVSRPSSLVRGYVAAFHQLRAAVMWRSRTGQTRKINDDKHERRAGALTRQISW